MKLIANLFISASLLFLAGCGNYGQKEKYYVKHIDFPENATIEQKVDMAAHLVPSPQQLEWQKMELTVFLHFGINTFTGREWGDGKEDPALFNPTGLDTDQWIESLKAAGFRMVIITAKHHDGFCLWPTRTTRHSVASSPWKDGKGDVIRELRESCSKYGMRFGVYLSPWDRNAGCYGDSPAYNRFFIEQLTELLTNYGEVHEVWFDGANGEGPNGKKQEYDWDAFFQTIQKLQPNAVMAIMGDDIRWVGNERGLGRETEWSATALTPGVYARSKENNAALGLDEKSADLGSRELLKNARELFWYPSEVDVSIRPGWFFHAEENDKVKSLKQMSDIYFQSVGYNSVLLLNIPPDKRGLIHENDVRRLKEFAEYRKNVFGRNYVTDGKVDWTAAASSKREYNLQPGSEINVVEIQEDITRGQRVESFSIEAMVNGKWELIAGGTTVGYKRMVRFPAVKADKLRLQINSTRLDANICNVAAYYAYPLQENEIVDTGNLMSTDGWKVRSDVPLEIDLGKTVTMTGFVYSPKGNIAKPTMAFKYQFHISTDGKNWEKVNTPEEFGNIMNNPQPQTVVFDSTVKARFIKLVAVTADNSPAEIEVPEFGVMVK